MSNNKEIKIKWISDESQIEKSVQNLQKKLQQIQKSNMQIQEIQSGGGQLSKQASYAKKVFERATVDDLKKESKELQEKQRIETTNLLRKQRELNQIKKMEGQITEEKQKQMDILKEEIRLKSQQIMQMESDRSKVDGQIESIQGGPQPQDEPRAMDKFKKLLQGIGIGAVVRGAMNVVDQRIERDRKVLADQGQTAYMSSRELREQVQGEGMRGMFFAGERQRAMGLAESEQAGKGGLDIAKLLAGTAGGAAAGSFLPGIGNVAGAVVGGLGAFGGMMAGSDRMFNRVFDQDAYRQMLTREGMQKYEQNRAMLELQDPMKNIAYQSAMENNMKDTSLERSLGLGDRDVYGARRRSATFNPDDFFNNDFRFYEQQGAGDQRGFLREQMNPYGTDFGFSRDDVEGSVQSLIGAGATTEGARGMAGQALAFQRNLKLQNAGDLLGSISGATGEGSTDNMVIRLMSEAVKMGVDASKMPQEMQRMTAVTAELATAGGGFSGMAASNFSAGLYGTNASAIAGAKSAFQEMQGRSKAGGGFEGQMGMGFLMGDQAAGAFGASAAGILQGDSKLMNALNQYSAEDLEKDPALAQGIAQQMGISTEELIQGVRQKDEYKQTRTSSQQAASMELGNALKGMNAEQAKAFLGSEEGSSLYSRAAIEGVASYGSGESGKGMSERRAGILGRARRLAGGMPGIGGIGGDLSAQLGSDANVSELEKIRSSRATGDQVKIEAVNKELDGLVNAAKKHTAATELYQIQFEKFVEFAKNSGDALEQMGGQIEKVVEMLAEKGIPPSGQPN